MQLQNTTVGLTRAIACMSGADAAMYILNDSQHSAAFTAMESCNYHLSEQAFPRQ